MAIWKAKKPERKFESLHEAVEAGDCVAVQRFLNDGMSANAQDDRGATGLHIAAARGYLEIAKLLIESGAGVDFLINDGGTPLMAASACLKPQLIRFLISSGAQPNKKGHAGRFPLVCPFQPAVILVNEQLECIKLLIEHGANINEMTDSGGTPLMAAAWFGNDRAVVQLLNFGADATLRDAKGRTAAMCAFERGHDDLAERLNCR